MESKPHSSAAKLLVDISVPTELRAPQAAPAPETTAPVVPIANTPAPTPAASPEIKTESAQAIPQPAPVQEPSPQPAPPPSPEMIEVGADVAIGMFDFSQQNIFKFFIKRKKNRLLKKLSMTSGDVQKLITAIEEDPKATQDFDAEQLAALRLEKDCLSVLDDLPLSEEDRKMLKVPLMAIMKQRGGTIPPEYMLILATLQIAGGRAADVMLI